MDAIAVALSVWLSVCCTVRIILGSATNWHAIPYDKGLKQLAIAFAVKYVVIFGQAFLKHTEKWCIKLRFTCLDYAENPEDTQPNCQRKMKRKESRF